MALALQLVFRPIQAAVMALSLGALVQVTSPPRAEFNSFHHASWSSDTELGAVPDIQQTAKGFLWLATSRGLLRFDGFGQNEHRLGSPRAILLWPFFGSLLAFFASVSVRSSVVGSERLKVSRFHPDLTLLQNPDDLLLRITALLHRQFPRLQLTRELQLQMAAITGGRSRRHQRFHHSLRDVHLRRGDALHQSRKTTFL